MKKKKKITLMIIGILLVTLIAVGTSYAYWKLSIRQESTNRYASSCFNVSINLDDSPITLNNAKPLSNEAGLKLEPYTFTIENTCDSVVNYSIQLNVLEESTLDSKYVRYSTTSNDTNIVGLQNKVEAKINNATAYEIRTGTLLKGKKQEINLRLWLDQYTSRPNGEGKSYKTKIVIDTMAIKEYADTSGAEQPILNNGLIPVTWNGTNWIKADITKKWYDYNEQWWANAVTLSPLTREKYINAPTNTAIEMNDIETMWVWIPRYEYQHTNLGDQYAGGTKEQPGGITINFISKDTLSSSSRSFTVHDAFWWDDNNDGSKDINEQLSGIWVAKFQMSTGTTRCIPKNDNVGQGCDLTSIKPRIKPNVENWRGTRIGTFWTVIHENMNGLTNQYGLTNSDVHLIKNMEWGAVAYLYQSNYGKYGNSNYEMNEKTIEEQFNNITGNVRDYITEGNVQRSIVLTYETEKGQTASTTGNIYGIYDMYGSSREYVMGIMKASGSTEPAVGSSTSSNSGWSGKIYDEGNWTDYTSITDYGYLKNIESKYYDLYDYGIDLGETRYHPGDATYETNGWYINSGAFVKESSMFFIRGFGGFVYLSGTGSLSTSCTSRPVLVAQPE